LTKLSAKEAELDHGYARLGVMLMEFEKTEGWRAHGFTGFDAFMEAMRTNFNRSRRTLYGYLSVAKKLLPFLDEKTLNEIGISKALEIKYALSFTGRKLTPDIVTAACDPKVTVKQLRAVLHIELELPADERPSGTWFDCGGWYMDTAEREEFVDCIHVGMAVLGIDKASPEWMQRKLIIMTALQEFYAAHAPEVYGPELNPEEEPR
jgi:hypothetical protein